MLAVNGTAGRLSGTRTAGRSYFRPPLGLRGIPDFNDCFEDAIRASGLVYARECVLFAGCKSLSELATAP
jgi:hypothetical protein